MTNLGGIKGAAFGEYVAWHAMRYGVESVEGAISAVERKHSVGFGVGSPHFGVLASHWYAAEIVHDLVDRLTDGKPDQELDVMARDAAKYIMGRTLRGVYRTIFSLFATPERYVRHVDKLWHTHYDTGVLVFRVAQPGVHHAVFSDWAGHHPFICRMNMASSVPIYEAMGCRHVSYERVRCISSGAACCENIILFERGERSAGKTS